MIQIITGIIIAILGGILGYFLRKYIGIKTADSAEKKAQEIIQSAKLKQQELYFRAKEKALKILDEAKKEEERRRYELKQAENKFEKRKSIFEQKILELEDRKKKIENQEKQIQAAKEKIKSIHQELLAKLEKIAGFTQEQAQDVLLANLEKEYQDLILNRIRKLEKWGQEEIEKKAREMIVEAMERCAASQAQEKTTTVFHLPNDEIKGRIIGKEGRNIRVLESLTGAELIIDETPEIVVISSFNPIRRELASRTLEKLIKDGRIQPARIERFVEETKKELAEEIKKAGQDALFELGITGLDPKLVQILGRLKFRTSYGQNALQHSIEVAYLAESLAQQLGVDVSVCKKAGLLHDIGKALDYEVQGSHPEIGRQLGEKYGLSEKVIQAIATHHEDKPPTLEAIIVKVADAISGARPGARRENYELFLKRLEDLENIAKSFEGVEKAYAIEAGRELRVFVNPQKINDLEAIKLAKNIAQKIEKEIKYPGEIKVNVIRENRVIEYAR